MRAQEIIDLQPRVTGVQELARILLVNNGVEPDVEPSMNMLLAEQAGYLPMEADDMRQILGASIEIDKLASVCWGLVAARLVNPTDPNVLLPAIALSRELVAV